MPLRASTNQKPAKQQPTAKPRATYAQTKKQQQHKQNYSVIHITGYTKVWPPNQSASNQNQNSSNIYQNHQ